MLTHKTLRNQINAHHKEISSDTTLSSTTTPQKQKNTPRRQPQLAKNIHSSYTNKDSKPVPRTPGTTELVCTKLKIRLNNKNTEKEQNNVAQYYSYIAKATKRTRHENENTGTGTKRVRIKNTTKITKYFITKEPNHRKVRNKDLIHKYRATLAHEGRTPGWWVFGKCSEV